MQKITVMKKSILLFFILIINITGYSQNKDYQTETKTHIFWQPDRKLTTADFQRDVRDVSLSSIKECGDYGYCVVGAYGLFYAVDVTKGKYKPGQYHEKLYIAPAFEKPQSVIIKPDSLGLEIQQTLFDIDELCARTIRYKLDHFYERFNDSTIIENPDNPYTMWFATIKDECEQYYGKMKWAYLNEVVIKKGDYEHWKNTVDTTLDYLKEYATTPEDCYRFVKNKPIEKKMVKAKYLAPSLYKK